MKNRTLAVAFAAFAFLVAPFAYADSNISTNSGSMSNSQSQAVAGNNSPVTVNGYNFTSTGSAIPPYMTPGIAASMPGTPQIFGGLTNPANVAGIRLIEAYVQQCNPVSTKKHPLADKYSTGESGRTQVVWSPNQDYYHMAHAKQSVESVKMLMSKGTFDCLGVITVSATAADTPLTTISADARIRALQLTGYKHIELLSLKDAIAVAKGVQTDASGWSLTPGLMKLFSLMSGGQVSGGYNSGNASSYSSAKLGDTYIVLARDPLGMEIDPAKLNPPPRPAKAKAKAKASEPMAYVITKTIMPTTKVETRVRQHTYLAGKTYNAKVPGPDQVTTTVKKVPLSEVQQYLK